MFIQISNKNRDNIEKAFLNDRIFSYNKPSEKYNLNSPDPKSTLFISDAERFNKDFASHEFLRRSAEKERKKQMYENFKNVLFEREKKRWDKMDYEYLREDKKLQFNRERNLVGKKNNLGYILIK